MNIRLSSNPTIQDQENEEWVNVTNGTPIYLSGIPLELVIKNGLVMKKEDWLKWRNDIPVLHFIKNPAELKAIKHKTNSTLTLYKTHTPTPPASSSTSPLSSPLTSPLSSPPSSPSIKSKILPSRTLSPNSRKFLKTLFEDDYNYSVCLSNEDLHTANEILNSLNLTELSNDSFKKNR